MKFDIYGRFQVEVEREHDVWRVYRRDAGKRVRLEELVIPAHLADDEIIVYLDDIFHELARPGREIVHMRAQAGDEPSP
ncbi:hypothetical protein QPK32_03265 [Massilia sp. YIM B02763]|uniref:DUF7661 family protein n=1 Tax=Massilia sp. YIM B02763 TaxID=3050130 RepID=UPI0025B6A5CF|nr:hypothetical protein [Massilia sp. YIM B02763]MDN4052094.1 hypothetical protein [Massilia sp. YIM B02763]